MFYDGENHYDLETPQITPVRPRSIQPTRRNPPDPYYNTYSDWSSSSSGRSIDHSYEQREMFSQLMQSQNKMMSIVDKISTRMDKVEEAITVMQDHVNAPAEKNSLPEKKRIPTILSKDIAAIHDNLKEEEKFKPSKGSKHEHNKKVKKKIYEELSLSKENYSGHEIERGIQRYFESRRRDWREQTNPNQQNRVSLQSKNRRVRARKVRLYNRRKKYLHEGTEKEKFQVLTIDYMSNESSADENGNIKVHQPIWRSSTLTTFLQTLDKRADEHHKSTRKHIPPRKPRTAGMHLLSEPPSTAPKWTLSDSWLEDHQIDDDAAIDAEE